MFKKARDWYRRGLTEDLCKEIANGTLLDSPEERTVRDLEKQQAAAAETVEDIRGILYRNFSYDETKTVSQNLIESIVYLNEKIREQELKDVQIESLTERLEARESYIAEANAAALADKQKLLDLQLELINTKTALYEERQKHETIG